MLYNVRLAVCEYKRKRMWVIFSAVPKVTAAPADVLKEGMRSVVVEGTDVVPLPMRWG